MERTNMAAMGNTCAVGLITDVHTDITQAHMSTKFCLCAWKTLVCTTWHKHTDDSVRLHVLHWALTKLAKSLLCVGHSMSNNFFFFFKFRNICHLVVWHGIFAHPIGQGLCAQLLSVFLFTTKFHTFPLPWWPIHNHLLPSTWNWVIIIVVMGVRRPCNTSSLHNLHGHCQSSLGGRRQISHCCRIAYSKLLTFILLFQSSSSISHCHGGRWTHIAVEYNIFICVEVPF